MYSFATSASSNPTFYADLTNPQSLNKYHYALANPLAYVDPDGHSPCCIDEEALKATMKGGEDILTGAGKVVANTWLGMNNTMAAFNVLGAQPVEPFRPTNMTQAVTMVIAEDVSMFVGFLSGRANVGGVVVAEAKSTAAITTEVAVNLANQAQKFPAAVRPKAAGAAQAVTGQITTATSKRGATPPSLHPVVQKFLDTVPQGARGPAHGRCCEPQLISNMLNAGVNPRGATISVVRVRPAGNPKHATPKEPCNTSQLLINAINK